MDPVDLFLIQLAAAAGAGWVAGQLLIDLAAEAVGRLRRRLA